MARNWVPPVDLEHSLGTSVKRWLKGHFKNLIGYESLTLKEQAAALTATSSFVTIYSKTNKKAYVLQSDGTEYEIGAAGQATWGLITGSLALQLDLAAALAGKQPLNTTLSSLAALSNSSGQLTNDGSGNLSWVVDPSSGIVHNLTSGIQGGNPLASLPEYYHLDYDTYLALQSGLGYVKLSPATAASNTVQPTADIIPLTLKGKASQTADLQQWSSSASAILSSMSATGVLSLFGSTNTIQLIVRANASQSVTNPLVMLQKSDGTELVRLHSDGIDNLFLGYNAGNANTNAAADNIFIGAYSGQLVTSSWDLTALGWGTLKSLVNGSNGDTAIGSEVLENYTTGYQNTGVGRGSLQNLISGHDNTAVGKSANGDRTSGNFNTALGKDAFRGKLTSLLIGNENVMVGHGAGFYINSDNNTVIGSEALYHGTGKNITGTKNVAIGYHAAYWPSLAGTCSGGYNTIVGTEAGYTGSLTSASNVFLGYQAGYYETGSSKLFIDNIARASQADGRIKALVYGVFDASVANQFLTVNGRLNVITNTYGTNTYLTVRPNVTTDDAATVQINTGADINKGLVVQANSATQTANIQEWQNSSSSVLAKIDASGNIGIRGVSYIWPLANAIGQLTNDGAGNLTWTADPSSGIIHNETTGLQGGDPLASLPEYYHLSLIEYNTILDLVNGTFLHNDLAGRSATACHPATAISYNNTGSTLVSIEVNGAIDELDLKIETLTSYHNDLSGLQGGDPLASLPEYYHLDYDTYFALQSGLNYVKLSPTTAISNTIQPIADIIPLTIKGKISQTANLQEWQKSNSGVYVSIGPTGLLATIAGIETTANSASATPLYVKAVVAQTANLTEWQAYNGSILAYISAAGNIGIRGVTYVWPSANALGQLTNDGSGNLSWTTDPSSGIIHNETTGLQGGDPLASIPEFYHLDFGAYAAANALALGTFLHNDLGGLNVGNYLHLTSAQYANLLPTATLNNTLRGNGTNWVASSVLYSTTTQVGVNKTTFGTVEKFGVNAAITVDNAAAVQINTGGDANKGLVIQGNSATQSANLQEWQNSAGQLAITVGLVSGIGQRAAMTFYDDDGITGSIFRTGSSGSGLRLQDPSGFWLRLASTDKYMFTANNVGFNIASQDAGYYCQMVSPSATRIGLTIRGATAQTSDLQQWQTSASSAIASMTIPTEASLGAELITVAVDRDFTGANNWSGTGWSISANTFLHVAGANAATLAGYAAAIGTTYQVTMTIVTTTAGTLTIKYGNASATVIGQIAGTHTAYKVLLTATTTGGLIVTPSALWEGSITNISIMAVTTGVASLTLKNSAAVTAIESRSVNSTSFGIGLNSLFADTTGVDNTAIGVTALRFNTTGSDNTALGYTALRDNTTGIQNVAIGSGALKSNVKGSDNVAIGYLALNSAPTASNNIAIGSYNSQNVLGSSNVSVGHGCMQYGTTAASNVAIGYSAGANLTSGGQNVAMGDHALYSGTDAAQNVAVGFQAQSANTGSYNTAIGYRALYGSGISNYNSAVGYYAMAGISTGSQNSAIGRFALGSITTGINNCAVGAYASQGLTSGGYNVSSGVESMYYNVTGLGNVGIGYQALYTSGKTVVATAIVASASYTIVTTGDTDFTLIGAADSNPGTVFTASGPGLGTGTACSNTNYSVAIGYQALKVATVGRNIGIGYLALQACTSGSLNIALSANGTTLQACTTGGSNIGIGTHQCLAALTTGSTNIAIGSYCSSNITTQSGNISIGHTCNVGGTSTVGMGTDTLRSFTGSESIAIGSGAGFSATSGSYHVFLGNQAGYRVTTVDSNVFVGYRADLLSATQRTNCGAIGRDAKVDQDNSFCIGAMGATCYLVGINTETPGAQFHVNCRADATKGIIVRGYSATQSANLQEWQRADGSLGIVVTQGAVGASAPRAKLFFYDSDGIVSSIFRDGSGGSALRIQDPSAIQIRISTTDRHFFSANHFGIGDTSQTVGNYCTIKSPSATKIGLIVKGAVSQSVDLQQWQNSSDSVLASISLAGGLLTSAARTVGVNSVATAGGTTVGAATDHVVVFTGVLTQTYTLPACATGRQLIIKNRSTGNVTVNRAGADTIDGITTFDLALNDSVMLIGNGTDWTIN